MDTWSEDPVGERDKKARKQEAKALRDAGRLPLAWERYRALEYTLRELQGAERIADHKVRFAVMIMGALNAAVFFVGMRSDVVDAIPFGARPVIAGIVILYVSITVGFFVQSIRSLWPRTVYGRLARTRTDAVRADPLGLRFHEDILKRDPDEYERAWEETRFDRLNADMARRAHEMAAVNQAKYAALGRVYLGLLILTIMTAVLMGAALLALV